MRIVVKVGTSTLAHGTGMLNVRRVERLTRVISDLKNAGHEIILVSSGAIGMGAGKLNLSGRPSDIPTKQAAATVGQCELMYIYDKLFGEYHHNVAQMLLTADAAELGIGDNDTLSALVAVSSGADLLVILSDIDGLYTSDPHTDSSAELIREVNNADDVAGFAGGTVSGLGTGGMATKIAAAKLVNGHGMDMIICSGADPDLLYDICEGKPVGTRFRGA